MNKTKVVVFTQKGKWNNIDEEILNRVKEADWDEKYPNANNPIVKCGFSGVAFLIPVALDKLSDEEGVFLVYDSIAGNSFQTLEQQCRGDKVYVLTHSTGNCQQSAFINWQPKPIVLSGMHTNSSEDHYYPLFDILTDDKDDKMNRIINQVFQSLVNAALSLVHHCMADPAFDPSTSPLAKFFPQNSAAGKALITYKSDGDVAALWADLLNYAHAQN